MLAGRVRNKIPARAFLRREHSSSISDMTRMRAALQSVQSVQSVQSSQVERYRSLNWNRGTSRAYHTVQS